MTLTLRRLSGPASTIFLLVLTVTVTYWGLSIIRQSVAFAFAINWALMGVAYVVWSVVPLRFANEYYRVRRFERSGRLYKALGIRLFQRVLRRSGIYGSRVFPSYVHGPHGAAALVAATVGPETAHCLVFVVVNVLTVDAALHRGWWDTAAWLFGFNVLLNGYPVLSLRQVRVRTERAFGRRGSTKARASQSRLSCPTRDGTDGALEL